LLARLEPDCLFLIMTVRSALRKLMDAPEFSLIACTLGQRESLGRFLDSLLAQEMRDFEVIVVDQSPGGHLDRLLDGYKGRLSVRHIRSQPGLSRSRNLGIRNARGSFLCFPDDDCWYPPDILSQLTRRRKASPDLDLILGKTVDQFGCDSVGEFRRRSGSVTKWNVWRSGNSNSMFVRRCLAIEIGGFDETLGLGSGTRFQSGEETDFILRNLARGALTHYDPELKVHHQQVDCNIGPKEFSRARAYSPGFGRVLRKHRYGVTYLLYRVVRSSLRSVLAAVALDYRLARYKMIWAVGTLQGYLAKG
jgi:glycosyltransferase involved in cell wall biosynthesis